MSIRRKIFVFASKQRPQVPKHFETLGKQFAIRPKTAQTTVFERCVLYGKLSPKTMSYKF